MCRQIDKHGKGDHEQDQIHGRRHPVLRLTAEAATVTGGGDFTPVDADPDVACFVPPTLLRCEDPKGGDAVHSVEAFGPVCTVMPYDGAEDAFALAARGGGSLAASVFTGDREFAAAAVAGIASDHGRVLVVDESIGRGQTGHGIVMPQCVHGGPGRAGGGEELGGLRALAYCSRSSGVERVRRREALRWTIRHSSSRSFSLN